jgi:hypothetical protein
MDADTKLNIRLRWLDSLFELSHIDFQRALWIDTKFPDIISNFDEAICKYFNDLDLEEGYNNPNHKDIYLPAEIDAVFDFHIGLSKYLDKTEQRTITDSQILEDPEWQQLTKLGRSTWNKVKQLLTDPSESKLTEELEGRYGQ